MASDDLPTAVQAVTICRETGECNTKYEMIGLCGGLQSLAPLERSYESDA